MCIIAVIPAGRPLPAKETFEICWAKNPDGGGFSFSANGGPCIQKGYFEFEKMYADLVFYHAAYGAATDFIIHFRISTSGGVTAENTHPFFIPKSNVALAHNGILAIKPPKFSGLNDTRYFIDLYLSGLAKNWFADSCIYRMVDSLIGFNNKFAVLDESGKATLFNRAAWIEDNGIFYSNDGYKKFNAFGFANNFFYSKFYKPAKRRSSGFCLICDQPLRKKDIKAGENICRKCLENEFNRCEECGMELTDLEIEKGYCLCMNCELRFSCVEK